MIKLQRYPKPSFLTDAKERDLVEEFKGNGKSVWNIECIKVPLLRSSHLKCSYCECNLSEESKYMEVEHFEDKKHYPDKVVSWENLLPSCKKCNGSKSTHNVIDEPILNPYNDDPRSHLALRLYRIYGMTEIGKSSIDVVGLNNQERLVVKRFEIGSQLSISIEIAWERYDIYKENKKTVSKNRLISLVEGLLLECQPTAIYAATTSTVLLGNKMFAKLIDNMISDNLWDKDLQDLMENAKQLVLKCV